MSSSDPKPVSVLFVCLGNICRSTMSEAVFTSLAASHPLVSTIDSCGTGAYHVGCAPDRRTLATLKKHGITDYKHRARQLDARRDFQTFDYVLAMDAENLDDLLAERTREVKRKGGEEGVGRVLLFGEFAAGGHGVEGKGRGEEVRDPYYGGNEGFDIAYEQAVRFSKGFLERLDKGELS
ncbi:Low molecular weight phosphotyrosine protein phosphatase [Pleosporales sp. CAS-2024a]